jgi:plastocyanin
MSADPSSYGEIKSYTMMKRMFRYDARWLVPAVALALLGPASAATTTGGSSSPTASVHIQDFTFVPATRTIHVGETVHFVNDDSEAHTVTAVDKSFDSEGLDKGNAWDHTFTKTGTYHYFCELHPSMKGTITVVTSGDAK